MVSLRPYRAEDVAVAQEQFYGLQAGELQWFGFSSAAQLLAEFQTNGLLTPDRGRFIVDSEGERVGGVQWFKEHWGPATTSWCWEIGISLRADARGRGVGTEAQVQLRDYLLDHTRSERIQATTDVQNIAEQRALDKAGFTREGRLRSAQWRAGSWHDQYLYAFVRGDR